MSPLKTVGLGFVGAVLAIGAWIALDVAGVVPGARLGQRGSDFEQRVRDYVIENPQVLVESLQRMQERQRATQTDEIAQIIASRREDIFHDPATPVGGNPQGDVSLVEFFDYNCPYCRRVAPTLVEIEKDDAKLRFVYKEWPILGPNSEFAARAALASRSQGKYVEFHKRLMLTSGLVNESKVFEVAAQVGLDVDRLKQDMEAPEITALIERNRDLARALRITGTPSFVIGDQMLRGAADAEVIRGFIRTARER
ncbi:MAG: DsbA family protein [Rhodospirillales bacterium]|nr:DsbA family protein [Rhodospirillales bacterium]